MRIARTWALGLVAFLSFTGCEEKREITFTQGDGEHLYSIEDFSNREFTLTTGQTIAPGKASKADLLVPSKASVITSFDSVAFNAQTPLFEMTREKLSNFDFFGRSDYEYKMQMRFTESHLVVFKIADKADIPSHEMTYAQQLAGNTYAVPLLGYPLQKFAVEPILDSRGKATDKKASFPKKYLSEATHFKIDTDDATYFDHEEKLDLIKASYFDPNDEWFYEFTVIDRPITMEGSRVFIELGQQIGSGKLRFARYNNSVIGVGINVPKEANSLDPEKLATVIEIPAQWTDYRTVTSGSDAFLKEEALDEYDEGAQDFFNRAYGLFDFSDVNNLRSEGFGNIKVTRLEVEEDFLSFVLYDSLLGLKIHFSFKKDNQKIAGRNYPLDDWNRFGFFSTQRSYYDGVLARDEEFFESSMFLTRLYPKDNEITFYLTTDSPNKDLYVDAVQEAVDAWDRAFSEAAKGTNKKPIRVKLNREKRVLNGDVRYNKVAFYGYDISSGLLGMGPSVADSRNGQVYSSTNNIYLRNYREGLLSKITAFVRNELKLFDDKYAMGVSNPSHTLAEQTPEDLIGTTANASLGDVFGNSAHFDIEQTLEPVTATAAADQQNPDVLVAQAIKRSRQNQIDLQERIAKALPPSKKAAEIYPSEIKPFMPAGEPALVNNHTRHKMANYANSFSEIERFCMNDKVGLGSYIDRLKLARDGNPELVRIDGEQEVFYECAEKLMKPTLISTLVHEFGHNFGLTHNFRGSADFLNYPRDENGQPIARSSSVMDYSHSDSDRGFSPGPYDIAAIRYGYYDAVELSSSADSDEPKIATLQYSADSEIESIQEQLGPNSSFREFKYCWDYDIDYYTQTPREYADCRRWDRGSNPVQTVLSLIDQFQAHVASWGNRFDSVSSYGLNFNPSSDLAPMRTIYEEFRRIVKNSAQPDERFHYYVGLDGNFTAELSSIIEAQSKLDYFVPITDLTPEQYKAMLEGTLTDDSGRRPLPLHDPLETEKIVTSLPVIQQYKMASDLAFKFLSDLALSDIEYCTVENDKGQTVGAESFEEMRRIIFLQEGRTVNSCQDASDYLVGKYQAYGASTVGKIGNRLNDTEYSADQSAAKTKETIALGMQTARLFATNLLTLRTVCYISDPYDGSCLVSRNMDVNERQGFIPNFLDNPIYRSIFVEKMKKRLLWGADISAGLLHRDIQRIENMRATVSDSELKAEIEKLVELHSKTGALAGSLTDPNYLDLNIRKQCTKIDPSMESNDVYVGFSINEETECPETSAALPPREDVDQDSASSVNKPTVKENIFLRRFSEESDLYSVIWYRLTSGLRVPGQSQTLRLFELIPSRTSVDFPSRVPDSAARVSDFSYIYYASPQSQPFMYEVIKSYQMGGNISSVISQLPTNDDEKQQLAKRLASISKDFVSILLSDPDSSPDGILYGRFGQAVQLISEYRGVARVYAFLDEDIYGQKEAVEPTEGEEEPTEVQSEKSLSFEEVLDQVGFNPATRKIAEKAMEQLNYEVDAYERAITPRTIENVVLSIVRLDYADFDPNYVMDVQEYQIMRLFETQLESSIFSIFLENNLAQMTYAGAELVSKDQVQDRMSQLIDEMAELAVTDAIETFQPYADYATQIEGQSKLLKNIIGLR